MELALKFVLRTRQNTGRRLNSGNAISPAPPVWPNPTIGELTILFLDKNPRLYIFLALQG